MAGALGSGGARYTREQSTLPALRKLPSAPEHLEGDDLEAYELIGATLVETGKLTKADLHVVVEIARSKVDLDMMRRRFRSGESKATEISACRAAYLRGLERLGLTPASRRTVGAAPDPDDDHDLKEDFA
jgi:phage terminase small subunit